MGSFPTSNVVNFLAMKSTLANVWHPVGSVSITNLGSDRYLFRFYFVVDINRIEKNGPWTFNSHLLIMHHLKEGEDL